MTGVFTMKPNDRNVRDMDFEISVNFEVSGIVYLIDVGTILLFRVNSAA